MDAHQSYPWESLYPDRVQRIAALCGIALTTDHNRIFLQSLRSALTADSAWIGTRFEKMPDRGFRAFVRIYESWAASQAFYHNRTMTTLSQIAREQEIRYFLISFTDLFGVQRSKLVPAESIDQMATSGAGFALTQIF